jgi:hypothetical protein
VVEFPVLRARYKPIVLRTVELDLQLDYPSKFDRSADLIADLIARGKAKSEEFSDDESRWELDDAARYDTLV